MAKSDKHVHMNKFGYYIKAFVIIWLRNFITVICVDVKYSLLVNCIDMVKEWLFTSNIRL